MTTLNATDEECLHMGRSILLHGLKRAMAVLQAQATQLESQLAVPVNGNGHSQIRPAMQRTMALIDGAEAEVPTVRRLSAAVKKEHGTRMRGWWAQFTPEERQLEMQRRANITKRRRKAAAKAAGL